MVMPPQPPVNSTTHLKAGSLTPTSVGVEEFEEKQQGKTSRLGTMNDEMTGMAFVASIP